jgi:hypothetical protein
MGLASHFVAIHHHSDAFASVMQPNNNIVRSALPELNALERTMLAKPEWNPERYEAPKKSQADFHLRSVDRYLMIATFAAGTSLLVVGLLAMQ